MNSQSMPVNLSFIFTNFAKTTIKPSAGRNKHSADDKVASDFLYVLNTGGSIDRPML